ncbi:hypothetical protein K1X76_10425 [bacterium]|nr:hypothetical protein [bacterium]
MKFSKYIALSLVVLTFQACSSSGGGSAGVEQVTVTGQVSVRSTDVAASLSTLTKSTAIPRFETVGDTVLANAEVTLVKINADGTETEEATTTTDSEGNYTLAQVDVCQAGTGADDDYYYEMRVTSGDVTVKAPACPTGDSEEVALNVSPESTVAAEVISNVADSRSFDNNPIPPAEQFEKVINFVAGNMNNLGNNIDVPALDDADGVLALANGIAAAGGDAEKSYKQFSFESEFVGLTNSEDATTDQMAGYMVRIARESTDQPATTPLNEGAAMALAEAMEAGTTFTPADVVEAFNSIADTPKDVDTEVTEYAADLGHLRDANEILGGTDVVEEAFIEDDQQVALYTQRELNEDTFASDTPLDADQALTFLMSLGETPGVFAGSPDITAVIAALTGSTALESPQIDEVQIYANSGFGCVGLGQGHFVADVRVYIPDGSALTVNSVVVTSTDTTALGGDGSVTLDPAGGNRYEMTADGNCVESGTEVTYTVTATFSDDSTATKEVTRNHPEVPEADADMDGVALSGDEHAATVVDVARPTFTWESPEDVLALITGAPAGSEVKYQYEYAHYKIGDGAPLANTSDCPAVTAGPLYSVDNFIPTIDCNVDACATAHATTPDQITCRLAIQTFLVDETDDILGQAAGDFKFFCVDTNGDDDCGE